MIFTAKSRRRLVFRIRGVAGYLIDLCGLMKGYPAVPHSYTKFRLIDRARRKTGARVFIETGTHLGVTADRCSSVFERVYTIELEPDLAGRAADFLSDRKNVTVIPGDALRVLPDILRKTEAAGAVIFLDGHFSGSGTACGTVPEPAVEEMKIMAEHKHKIKAVVIDDLRCFGSEPGFPSKEELVRTAESYFGRDFDIAGRMDQLLITRRP